MQRSRTKMTAWNHYNPNLCFGIRQPIFRSNSTTGISMSATPVINCTELLWTFPCQYSGLQVVFEFSVAIFKSIVSLMAVSPGQFLVRWPFLDLQMNKETEDDFYQSEDDLDEDEATQYIIEQSLIEYRKLKGLNPRLISDHLNNPISLYSISSSFTFLSTAIWNPVKTLMRFSKQSRRVSWCNS